MKVFAVINSVVNLFCSLRRGDLSGGDHDLESRLKGLTSLGI